MARPLEDVYCTLLMSDSYLPGAAVLAHSLRDAGAKKKLAVLVTLETLSADTITKLKALYDYLIPVERIRNPNPANLYVMGRPDLSFAFTKIALWRQTQFRKIVYLDADVVALRPLDELFDIKASFAAAPDIGWPDAFNSGVMVIKPDMGEYWALQTLAATGDSFDGADQGLLNQYFEHRPWQRLKFTYNCTPNAEYQWEPAYRHYKRDISAVHFIGKDKPWSGQRSSGSGVYGELLARWWAVFDRHLRQQHSQGEAKSIESNKSHAHSAAPVPDTVMDPNASITTAEPPLTEPGEVAENVDQGLVEPTPTVQQRKFSAPEMQWDATRSEPPAQSRPEAANFPSQTYTFSDSHTLFRAPPAYPKPPRDLWYKLPESRPKSAKEPKPIFPWEREPDRPRATRVFAEDLPPEPTPVPAVPSPTHAFSTVHYQDELEAAPTEADVGVTSPGSVSSPKSADEQWQAFQQSNVNAWDSVPGIENYVRAIMESHGQRGQTQVIPQATGTDDLGSPLLERRNRRESLILTDFPSAIERPSLPVTPAPLRRPSFWGGERDEAGELPAAKGVPDQTDWDPNEQLEQLRRSSVVEFEHLKKDEHPNPPLRALPEHSTPTEEDARPSQVALSGSAPPHGGGSLGGATEKSEESSVPTASLEESSSTEHHSVGRVSQGASTDDQLKGQHTAIREVVGDNPVEQPPAPSLDVGHTPEASGIVGKDFASDLSTEDKSQGSLTSEGLVMTPSTSSTEGVLTEQSHGAFESEGSHGPFTSEGLFTTPSTSSAENVSTEQRQGTFTSEGLLMTPSTSSTEGSHGRSTNEGIFTTQSTSSTDVDPTEQSFSTELGDWSSSTGQGAQLFAQGGFSSQPYSSFGRSTSGDNTSSQVFSSSSSNTLSQSQHASSTQRFSAQQQSSSQGEKIQAGKTSFNLLDFADANLSEDRAAEEEMISPTQAEEEGDERKGHGLF